VVRFRWFHGIPWRAPWQVAQILACPQNKCLRRKYH
jgi:hypothetical protein